MKAKKQLMVFSAVMALIIVSAYAGWIPTKLHAIPFYDSAGHFALYGMWGYFFGRAFPKAMLQSALYLPTGIAVAVIIAIVEEFLQQLSPRRSFSLYDLMFGLCGIAVALLILNLKKTRHFSGNA